MMKQRYLAVAIAGAIAGMVTFSAGAVQAGTIERACLRADRSAATKSLCSCIEDVAKPMFSRSEMRRIAKFFKEPHLTQELRQSDRRSDERFWDQYKAWGAAVRGQCG